MTSSDETRRSTENGEKQNIRRNASAHAEGSVAALPLRSTLMKVVALSVKAARNSSRFDRDGEFATGISKEAVELTRPWMKGVEEELERLGVDLDEVRQSRGKGRRSGGDGLLAIVPGVANTCLKLLRSGEDDGRRKVRLLREMYASVHANLQGAEEEVRRLEGVVLKERKRRRRKTHRSADADAVEAQAEEPQRPEESKAVDAAAIPAETPVEAPVAAPPSGGSVMSSVKRLPRSASMETQRTGSDDRPGEQAGSRSVRSHASRAASDRSHKSAAKSTRTGTGSSGRSPRIGGGQEEDTKPRSGKGSHHESSSKSGVQDLRAQSRRSSVPRGAGVIQATGGFKDGKALRGGSGLPKRSKKSEKSAMSTSGKSTSPRKQPADAVAGETKAPALEPSSLPQGNEGRSTPSVASRVSRHLASHRRQASITSSKHSAVSLPESSRSRASQNQHLTPKTSLSLHPQRPSSPSSRSGEHPSSRQPSTVSRGRSRTSKLRVIQENGTAAVHSPDNEVRDAPAAQAESPKKTSTASGKRRGSQQTAGGGIATAAPAWDFANLNEDENGHHDRKEGDSRPAKGSRASSKVSSSRHATDVVSEIHLTGPQIPKLPRKCHHRASSSSACSSAAWSCELVADENGNKKVDDRHVHRRAGGCS